MAAAARLVIFDCDGVLVDSERLVQRVDLAMIADLGWPITVEEIHAQHLGRTSADVLANVERHIGRPVPSGWADRRRETYRSLFATDLTAVPGVVDTLDYLHANGYATCVASSGSHDAIRHSLQLTGLWDTFAGRIFSAQDVARGKPAPDLFLHAATTCGYQPAACIVVEDSPAGVQAGNAAGMTTIGYAGLTPAPLLQYADSVITTMTELDQSLR